MRDLRPAVQGPGLAGRLASSRAPQDRLVCSRTALAAKADAAFPPAALAARELGLQRLSAPRRLARRPLGVGPSPARLAPSAAPHLSLEGFRVRLRRSLGRRVVLCYPAALVRFRGSCSIPSVGRPS